MHKIVCSLLAVPLVFLLSSTSYAALDKHSTTKVTISSNAYSQYSIPFALTVKEWDRGYGEAGVTGPFFLAKGGSVTVTFDKKVDSLGWYLLNANTYGAEKIYPKGSTVTVPRHSHWIVILQNASIKPVPITGNVTIH
ncbi:hypothetical protein GOP56_07230 [Brevibacillus sp. 7WMA2]|uniref:Uncharacterized protein n=1 Tax=Brevibacillus laterosporus LMG 15441 TaxID=1042163 RepID=A0A075R780_BRELA|nr:MULTISPECIES: hypothetical protein [Brevibacillus]AIG27256.1 hypothetical protein BRLA_c029440 [Brevibacillus laterosporus LMG 15441]ERM16544.1 hypothetical protein P615_23295 [Brevibacillus laterosporus PE36]MCR8997114.1 hypothetical protein [Brevibacillus laterosporus]MDF9412386.1 hypothetical protein [Brevibacillus laterosporus]PCN44781.1 hypothetical protein B9C88_08780 [Brevibacillus laterosporus]